MKESSRTGSLKISFPGLGDWKSFHRTPSPRRWPDSVLASIRVLFPRASWISSRQRHADLSTMTILISIEVESRWRVTRNCDVASSWQNDARTKEHYIQRNVPPVLSCYVYVSFLIPVQVLFNCNRYSSTRFLASHFLVERSKIQISFFPGKQDEVPSKFQIL